MSGDMVSRAVRLGLNEQAFSACLADSQVAGAVASDKVAAAVMNILGTPAFLVGIRQANGKVRLTEFLEGSVPMLDLRGALDRVHEQARQEVGFFQIGYLTTQLSVAVVLAVLAMFIVGLWLRRRARIVKT